MSGTEPTLEALASENAELKKQLSDVTTRLAVIEQQSSVQRPHARPPRPNGSLTSRVMDRYLQEKDALLRKLTDTLVRDYRYVALRPFEMCTGSDRSPRPVPGQWYDPSDTNNPPSRVINAEQLIRAVAAYLTNEAEVASNLKVNQAFNPGEPTARIERLEVELAALKQCTDDLVSASGLTVDNLHSRFTAGWVKVVPKPKPEPGTKEAKRAKAEEDARKAEEDARLEASTRPNGSVNNVAGGSNFHAFMKNYGQQ